MQTKKHRFASPHARSGMAAFTLIEMMVSVSLFLIVMVISLGAVLAIVDGNKKAQAINSVSNNLSSAIESMVRDIKTGYGYSCGNSVTFPFPPNPSFDVGADSCIIGGDTGSEITFVSTISGDKRSVKYRYVEEDGRGYIEKTFCPAALTVCSTYPGHYRAIKITSPDIDVKTLEFTVNRPKPASVPGPAAQKGQPSVFILLKGTAYVNKTSTSDFSMQTMVSQRVLNI